MLLDRWLKTEEKADEILHTGRERPIRSLVKAISWRVTGTVDTIMLSWLFTGNIGTALSIGLTEVLTKMFLYYAHERVWNRIHLGRERVVDAKDSVTPMAAVRFTEACSVSPSPSSNA